MTEMNPTGEKCLTEEERRELQTAWQAYDAAQQPFQKMVAHVDGVDCDELHDAFLHLADLFEEVERAIMRAQQVRLLHAGHSRK